MVRPMVENVNIGDRMRYDLLKDSTGYGEVVSIIKAGESPTDKQLTEYYEVDKEDRIYNQVRCIIDSDRLVLEKENGQGYVIIPNTIHLRGSISEA